MQLKDIREEGEIEMKIYIVGEYREQFPSKLKERNFNPHPSYSCITDIQKACEEKGLDCIYYGGVYELIHAIDSKEHFDSDVLFFNISDGLTQSYCRIQAPVLLELMGVKYTGSSPFAVGLMNNKHYTKLALNKVNCYGVSVPKDLLIESNQLPAAKELENIGYPMIIKPNNDGFSMGIDSKSVVYSYAEAEEKILLLQKDYSEILAEEYIPGTDVSVFLVGNASNIVVNEAIIYKTYGVFHQEATVRDIYAKADKLSEKYPAADYLSQDLLLKLKAVSAQIFELLHVQDIARIDYRITADNKIYFLEINANPVLSAVSDANIVCRNLNISYSDLIFLYINTALDRYK